MNKAEKDARAIDCGDNSCMFATKKGGMRTNGGCRCLENAGFYRSTVKSLHEMLPEILRLRDQLRERDEEIERLREEIEALTHEGRQGELEQANVGLAQESEQLRAERDACVAALEIYAYRVKQNDPPMCFDYRSGEPAREALAQLPNAAARARLVEGVLEKGRAYCRTSFTFMAERREEFIAALAALDHHDQGEGETK